MSFGNWQYLLVLIGCLVLTLPLELALGARVYRSPRRLGLTLVITMPAFVVWDVAAAARDVWWFSPEYLIGWSILGLPLEEWLFFLVIPVCALLTYEAVGHMLSVARARAHTEVRHDR